MRANRPLSRVSIDDAAGQKRPPRQIQRERRSDRSDAARASSTLLTLSSTVAKPMMLGVNVVPRPVACAVNSCHQS